jgi:signal transduction histidine kinase
MSWFRHHATAVAGATCAVALGVLLTLASRGADAAVLPWRGAFMALAVALLLCGIATARRKATRLSGLGVAVSAGILAVASLLLPMRDSRTATAPSAPPRALAAAVAGLERGTGRLAALAAAEAPRFANTITAGGEAFRLLAPIPAAWDGDTAPLRGDIAAALWSDGQIAAWTEGMLPLSPWMGAAGEAVSRLEPYRDDWVLRRLQPCPGGMLLELQWRLPKTADSRLACEIEVTIGDGRSVASYRDVDLDGDATPMVVRVRPPAGSAAIEKASSGARLLAIMLLVWSVLLVALAASSGRAPVVLAAALVARAFLAAVDFRQWLVASFPSVEMPTAPGSWSSLIDPSYFATPVGGGWFATTADALLTAVLLASGVRLVHARLAHRLEQRRLRAGNPGSWWTVAAFGLGAAALLPALRSLVILLAENANARLIGPGVTLSLLTFWGLHIVLLLLALSGLGLLALLAVGARSSVRGATPARLGGVVVFALVGAGAWLARTGAMTCLLAGSLAAAVWWFQAWARAESGRGARLAWPALVLVAALWNYASLRHVHDTAERAWLERRAGEITDDQSGWSRSLIQTVLIEMQQGDDTAPAEPLDEPWRDEAAWRLYRGSLLYGLRYAGLVEILDRDERSESLFAAGFLRDFHYETMARSGWLTAAGVPAGPADDIVFQSERRLYTGGQEDILVAEAPRRSGRGWLRVEVPLRSWRVSTLTAPQDNPDAAGGNRYRPRQEVDRPVLLLLADDGGWRGSGAEGFPGPDGDAPVAQLRTGLREWALIPVGGHDWLCRWTFVPASAARAPGEGFLIGVARPTFGDTLLDASRMVLIDMLVFVVLAALVRLWRLPLRGGWQPGFQEKFLAGYLFLGLVLLLMVGLSVDRVGYERVRAEARQQARDGLTMALQQLGGLLSDQARVLADSGRLDDAVRGPVGIASTDVDLRSVVLFGGDGRLLFDGSPVPLSLSEASALLEAARTAPVLLVQEQGDVQACVAVPVALGRGAVTDAGHGGVANDGLLLYRQRLDGALVSGLSDLLQGEVTLSLDGRPRFTSHPEGLFEGTRPPLVDAGLMATLFDHPQGPGLSSPAGRPFACDAGQPLPAFKRDETGALVRRQAPAVLSVSFPGREREFAAQRRANLLFVTGLANLILLTALLLAALMSWSLSRPLRVLMGATRSLAEGDYTAPLPAPGHDEVGRLAAAFGRMRGQLQHARDDLAARERFLATVLERVPVGVAVLSGEGEPLVVNPAGRAILARSWPHEPINGAARRLRDGFGPHGPAGAPVSGELAVGDGRSTLRGAVAPLDEAAANGDLMIVFEDISEFLATKKLALNAELARQVAHEIKNPLTPIQLSVQLLGQAWQDRHPQLERIVPETVERVLEQVNLLRRIASEFSLLGRPDELARRSLDLPVVVSRVVGGYAGAEVTVRGTPPADLPQVLAHEESLQKILGNLMQNSLDAARPGVPAVIDLAWSHGDGRVRLIWRDNGVGLGADVAARLFEPYFSTKSKGTGLGLAICRSLAERMGGNISLAGRADGPGAEAVLELAAATGEAS